MTTDSMHSDPGSHSAFRAVVMVFALSLHSIFEGMAIGLRGTTQQVLFYAPVMKYRTRFDFELHTLIDLPWRARSCFRYSPSRGSLLVVSVRLARSRLTYIFKALLIHRSHWHAGNVNEDHFQDLHSCGPFAFSAFSVTSVTDRVMHIEGGNTATSHTKH